MQKYSIGSLLRQAILPLLLILSACNSDAVKSEDSKAAGVPQAESEAVESKMQFIVGFATTSLDPSDASVLDILAQDLDCAPSFLRVMSGNAAVYVCDASVDHATFSEKLQSLANHPDISYAELDQIRRAN